jgi:hypothetical protein
MLVGRRGQVHMRMQLIIRFDHGSIIPWVRRTETGIRAVAGPDTLVFSTSVQLRNDNFRTDAQLRSPGTLQTQLLCLRHESAYASFAF